MGTSDSKEDIIEYYESLLRMTSMDGWKHYVDGTIEGINELRNQLENPALSESETGFIRGRLHTLRTITNFEDSLNHAYDEYIEQTEGSADENEYDADL